MKPKNQKLKLERRILHFQKESVIQKANRLHPGAYTKPGSQKK